MELLQGKFRLFQNPQLMALQYLRYVGIVSLEAEKDFFRQFSFEPRDKNMRCRRLAFTLVELVK